MADGYATFGSYLLLKQRAEDGLGTLWRAGEMERAGFKRVVWLRRFDQPNLDRTAFETEVSIANQIGEVLKATNVARNQVLHVEGGIPYIAWDFVPSQPLDQLFQRVASEQFPVAIDNALLIVEKISSALAAALAVEVGGEPMIHGFLVPPLVMVGNDGEAVVAGFGATKAFLANLDRTAVRELAAPYLAPEVLSSGHSSRRADVYSLGAVLYQLLAGQPLPAEPAARTAVLERPQLALDEGPVPDDVAVVLKRALASRPEDRHSSAADFKRDLEKLLYGGAYSPTTFNLALFMDRLYRQDIEEEDQEIQREKSLDVASYYRPAKTPPADAPVVVEAAPGSKVGLYAALGGVAILLAVVGYLLLGRGSGPAMDQEQFAQLVQSEVMRQLEALEQKEAEVRAELEAERLRAEELRKEIEERERAAARGGRQQVTAEDQQLLDQARRDLAAREAEQRRIQAELARVQEERAREESRVQAAAVVPTAVPTAVPVVPTQVPEPAPVAPAAAVDPEPVAPAPTRPAVAAPAPPAVPALGLGGPAVRAGDMVDRTQVDVAPQVIKEEPVRLSRAATQARVRTAATVILEVLVDHTGVVQDVRVLRGFPTPGLGVDESCVEAARKFRFRPASKAGVPVKTWATVTMNVDLSRVR